MDTTMVGLNLRGIPHYQMIRGIDRVGRRVEGELLDLYLMRHERPAAPAGALILQLTSPPEGGVIMAVLVVNTETASGLRVLWEKQCEDEYELWGGETVRVLERLLAEHPVATSNYALTWGNNNRGPDYQGPNTGSGLCHWCGGRLTRGQGRSYGQGSAEWMEHLEEEGCVRTRAQNGDPCDECGVTVSTQNGHRQYRHGEKGTWTARHNAELDCTRTPVPSYEEIEAAERAEAEMSARESERRYEEWQREREEALERRARLDPPARAERDARRAEAADRERAAEEAEAARVTALEPARTVTSVTVRSKPIWSGASEALMVRHDLELSDGSTGTRWTISWGEGTPCHQVHECATEAQARARYREVFYHTACPEEVPRLGIVRSDPDAPYEGPTMEISEKAEFHEHYAEGGFFEVGEPQYAEWRLMDEEETPGWGPETIPGYTVVDPHRRGGYVVPLVEHEQVHGIDECTYSATVRPATEEEARYFLVEEAWQDRVAEACYGLRQAAAGGWSHYDDRPLGASPDEAVALPICMGLLNWNYRVDRWGECLWRSDERPEWRPLTPALRERIEEVFDLFPPLD